MTAETHAHPSLWHVFAQSAQRRGAATALDFGTHKVTFLDLHGLALRAAALLVSHSVTAGDVVALQLSKRTDTYALMLGCLRLGAIYAPLDPKNPPARTTAMLNRIRPKVLVSVAPLGNPHGATIQARTDAAADMAAWPVELADDVTAAPQSPMHPAYVMFTSGSSGEPKGAVIPQQGVHSLMAWARTLYGDPDQHRCMGFAPLHFDGSVCDFACGVLAGATLIPIETGTEPDPAAWAQRLAESRATIIRSVPMLLLLLDKTGALDPMRLPDLKIIDFGGEAFPIEHLRCIYQRFRGAAMLVHVYGPTETSCLCSYQVLDDAALAAAGNGSPSIGRLRQDFPFRVLDDAQKPVAPGETGELWIGGANVALGYYGNPEETARRFQQDPLQSDYPAIYYRTGDLVSSDACQNLWFHGRRDNQIKLAGHRIELEEIDAAIEALPGVHRALTVLADREHAPQLISIYQAAHPQTSDALSTAVAARLPAYMRPTQLIQVVALPVNANGKTDRRAALHMAEAALASRRAAADIAQQEIPAPQAQVLVRAAWEAALGHSDFTVTDNFFDVGGTSLGLARVLADMLQSRPRAATMTGLFAHPTIAAMAALLDGRSAAPVSAQGGTHAPAARGNQQRAALQSLRRRAGGPTQ